MECFAEPSFNDFHSVKREFSSVFDGDNIFEFIDLEANSSPNHHEPYHYSPSTEESTEHTKDGAADTTKASRSVGACDIEARLWKALRDFASVSPIHTGLDSLMDQPDEDNSGIVTSPQVHQSSFDSFISSPPHTPDQSPVQPVIESFKSLAVRRQKSRSPSHGTSTRISKSPRKLNLPAMLTTSYPRPAHLINQGRSAAVHDHLAHANHYTTYTPPHSGSYKLENFPPNYGIDILNTPQNSTSQNGLKCPDNTPVDAFLNERLLPDSSFEDTTFAVYDARSQMSQQAWGRTATLQQQKPPLYALQTSLGLGISGSGLEANVGVAPAMLSKSPIPNPGSMNGFPKRSNQAQILSSIQQSGSPGSDMPLYMRNSYSGCTRLPISATPIHSPMPVCPPIDIDHLYPDSRYAYPKELVSPKLGHARHHYADQSLLMTSNYRSRRDTSQQQQHRRSKSGSYDRRKRPSPSKRNASLGFVNFTPNDSNQILSGVAPSGSSKTKARREKEAADKMRKQMEAAKKAVERAGGDIGIFQEEEWNVDGNEDVKPYTV